MLILGIKILIFRKKNSLVLDVISIWAFTLHAGLLIYGLILGKKMLFFLKLLFMIKKNKKLWEKGVRLQSEIFLLLRSKLLLYAQFLFFFIHLVIGIVISSINCVFSLSFLFIFYGLVFLFAIVVSSRLNTLKYFVAIILIVKTQLYTIYFIIYIVKTKLKSNIKSLFNSFVCLISIVTFKNKIDSMLVFLW